MERVWRLQDIVVDGEGYSKKLETSIHKTIKKVTEDYETLKFNTAIAALMSLLNEINDIGKINREELKTYLILLNPVAPHITEEIWERVGLGGMLHEATWPKWDENKLIEDVVEIAIQVNGKVRGREKISIDESKESVRAKVLENARIKKFIGDKKIVKEIYIPGKIYNIVIK